MSNSAYTIGNYQPEDFDRYVLLCIEAEKLEPIGGFISPQVIAEHLGQPNYSPEQDLFIAEVDGDIVGYIDIKAELAIGRVVLGCRVHPEHRRRGLATELFSCAAHRARELGVGAVHVNIMSYNAAAKSVLSRLGFSLVRRFHELGLDMADVHWPDIGRAVLECRHLQKDEEVKLTRIQNLTFAGHWGYNPNTVEEITYKTHLSDFSPEDVILACDGDKIGGFCWTRVAFEGGSASGEREGQIYMIGVAPEYRGKGAGKGLLLAGLNYLKSKGLKIATLFVDSENEAACALYESVGFRVRTSSLWYERVIN